MSTISRKRCDSCHKEINDSHYGASGNWIKLKMSEGFAVMYDEYDFCSEDCLKNWLHSGDRSWNQ